MVLLLKSESFMPFFSRICKHLARRHGFSVTQGRHIFRLRAYENF